MKVIRGAGSGSKGGSNRTPTEADDSLQSVQFAKVLDLLSEGPIQGLDDGNKSIYLDKTPIQDAAGTNNFQNYTVVTKNGTQDQAYITDSGTPATPVSLGTGGEMTVARGSDCLLYTSPSPRDRG